MQFGWPRRQKPAIATPLDRTHPLLDGLIWFSPCWENTGSTAVDVIGGNNLILPSTATWAPGNSPQLGAGITSFTNGTKIASGAWPAAYQSSSGPYSVVCAFQYNGVQVIEYAGIFGLQSSNAGASNSQPIILQWNGYNQQVGAYFNNRAVYLSSYTIVPNVVYVAVLTVNGLGGSGSSSVRLYQNGNLVASGTGTGLGSAIGWGTGSGVGISDFGLYTWTNCTVYWGGVYNRVLSVPEGAAWATNPWQIFSPSQGVVALATALPGFHASPSTIYADNSTGQTLTLTGFATTWNSSTTNFQVSGVSGVSKSIAVDRIHQFGDGHG